MIGNRAFDGLPPSANLLPAPRSTLPDTSGMLSDALRPEGVFYVSMKPGRGERTSIDLVPEGVGGLGWECPVASTLSLTDSIILQSVSGGETGCHHRSQYAPQASALSS